MNIKTFLISLFVGLTVAAGSARASVDLSIQQSHGRALLQAFASSTLQRGLTSAQQLTMAHAIADYKLMLEMGEIQGFIDTIGSVTVDGVVITNAIVNQWKAAAQVYATADAGL